MKKKIQEFNVNFDGPYLDAITVSPEIINHSEYPFCLDIIKNLSHINFPTQVTFFVGENGAGKSTILEAIALKAGFGPEGGSKNIYFKTAEEKNYMGSERFAECMTLSWRQKPKNGYFFRAESFFTVANHLDLVAKEGGGPATFDSYGGKSLHHQSHGESFLSFFQHRLGMDGFFIFDEPEAALSPQRQLALMIIIDDICKKNPKAQFIIATHSPILLAFPDATIYSCDAAVLESIDYRQTQHYQITKQFLDDPERYLHHMFEK